MTGRKRTYLTAGVLSLPLLGFTNEVTAAPQWIPQSEQGRQAQSRETMRWQGMDANRDGRITRAEWRGNARAFDNHDWNNDGVLSGDEVRPGATEWEDERATSDWTDARFRDLDRNRDGRLTRA